MLEPNGNIACATEPYQFAQDAASAIRTFRSECWYDATVGLPYWRNILGQLPAASFVQSEIMRAALTAPNITSATVTRLVLNGPHVSSAASRAGVLLHAGSLRRVAATTSAPGDRVQCRSRA